MTNTVKIPLSDLLLDERNPRLPLSVSRSQNEMIEYLAKTTSITELMTAIGENDYFPGEPLVVIPDGHGRYIVVEGNRRFAALKLLSDPELFPSGRRVREAAESAQFRPQEVPCVVFDTRDQVVNYLGYRHITGVKQWEPLAKARYIAAYFDNHTDAQAAPGVRYAQVARGIGSQAPYIKRQLDGLAVYQIAEDHSFFNIKDLDEENISFSLLSTAVGYESILSFLTDSQHPYVSRGEIRTELVERIFRWMFEKDESGATILGDSRNIQKLAHVVENAEATAALTDGDSLDAAYAQTKGVSADFMTLLIELEALASRAVSLVSIVEIDSSHQKRVSNIFKQVRTLNRLSEDDDA